jgi:carboxyl-terminal processing protease
MSIRNRTSVIIFPLIIAITLVAGIYIGLKLSQYGFNNQLMIYPRGDKVNTVLNLIEDSYVDTISREKLEETAIESILKTLDPHSVYIPPREVAAMNEPLEGNFSGVGIQFNSYKDTFLVISVIKDGPAHKAGVKAGDRIVTVNSIPVAGKKMTTDSIIGMLKGKKGSNVNVSIKRRGQKNLLAFTLTRNLIPLPSIDAAYMITPTTGYIKINKFAKTTHEEFVKACKELHRQGMTQMLLDLRENTGGLLEAAIDIADEFLDDHKLIVYTQGRARARTDAYSEAGGECLNDKLVILIDEYTASASEILAGAIQDNERGTIAGRRSFGKGLVQEQSPLPGGAMIRLTIARYYTPSGRCIQKSYQNGKAKYYDEIRSRTEHGELEVADSIKFDPKLQYHTTKGRIVYGGGGIMPDLFIPADTSGFTPLYYLIHRKGLLSSFVFEYTDRNRLSLEKIKSSTLMVNELTKNRVLDNFYTFLRKEAPSIHSSDFVRSKKIIENELYTSIIRNFFDETEVYKLINNTDKTVNIVLKQGFSSL